MALCAVISYCATPISPTGGPPDDRPPQILFTEPETGTVNFSNDNIIIHFDDFVDRGSFQQALRVEPSFGLNYALDWGRSSVAVEFERELPDSTTFIINISTDFSDLNGNSLDAPVKIAVSTGATINKGKITGRVLDARTGESNKGERVLLYRLPADFSKPANYIAETDTSSIVRFSYLRPGDYLAFWVDDQNRNGIWDSESERAQSFGKKIISLSKQDSTMIGTLFIAKSDTTNPSLGGIGLFSTHRLRLRFSENIVLSDSTEISVTDTTGTLYSGVLPLYLVPDQPYILFAQSKKALKEEQSYQLRVQNVADEAGNALEGATQTFTGSSQADTTAQRIISAAKTEGVYPTEGIEITYAKPISKPAIRDSVVVVTPDSAYAGWKYLRIRQNNLWVMPRDQWQKGIEYEIRVWQPLLQDYQKLQPNIWFESDLGAINITLAADSASKIAGRPTQLLLKRKTGQIVADTTFTDSVTVNKLAPATYQLIAYQDLNNNDEWDPGQINPYVAPEPYFIQNKIPVEPGFTGELKVAFKNLPDNNESGKELMPDSLSTDSSFVPLQNRQ